MICESCKTNIPEKAKVCWKCGNKIEQQEAGQAEDKREAEAPVSAASSEPLVSASEAESSVASAGPAAGEKIADSASARREEKGGSLICVSCGNNVPEQAKFCPRCGSKIEQKEPAQAEAQPAAVAAPVAVTPVAAPSDVPSEPASPAQAAESPVAETAAGATAAESAAPGPTVSPAQTDTASPGTEKPVNSGKPASGGPLPLIIVLVALFIGAVASGYYYYTQHLKKEAPKSETRPMTGTPGQAQVPAAPPAAPPMNQQQPTQPATQPGSQAAMPPQQAQPAPQVPVQPASQAGQAMQQQSLPPIAPPVPQDQYEPPPQPRTRVLIKASALAADFRNGRPVGLSTSFRYGASRVVHYVQYARASVGMTTLSSQYYLDGRMLFKCGPSQMQYKSGKYFCRPQQDLNPGNYEVRFFVDGNEEQILKFSVTY